MGLFRIIPTLIVIFLFYNISILTFKSSAEYKKIRIYKNSDDGTEIYHDTLKVILKDYFDEPLRKKSITLPSGQPFDITKHDLILIMGMLFLFFEICKSTNASNLSIMEHVLSIFLFAAFLFEFLSSEFGGTSLFLKLTIFSFIDVISGIVISITAARRDVSIRQ